MFTRLCAMCMLAGAALTTGAAGAIVEYEDEASFLGDLAAAGRAVLIEDFEGPDWDHVRSNYPDVNAAPLVTRKGITWTGNESISTNTNWGRNGTWGIFTIYEPPVPTPDELFGASSRTLYAVGGWFNSNPDGGADIAIEIDGVIVAQRNIGAGHQFLGVISTEGFASFYILDLEQEAVWGADDFTVGITACPADVNTDATVNVFDLLDLLAAWGPCDEPGGCPSDLAGSGPTGPDGQTNVFDLPEMLAHWGDCP